ncbi:4-hydroxyphenylacetate 3-monooxygenase, reductase component [Chitinasiproducens palmae]|uniref:4-hydroxyphenylacetate 3-monooxygenase reductase component n=1 Tax=Chitinasiproducens palmae TaxID=1770053 RepID=A0A1H2PJ45_9BURK|nr:4-hydroxyphenylacetate 3-monooxygenase, reductase component [Chitinasiproducens palmae]SDV46364.1 4-hydroxyphenylacetate 3-monooxygenase reductase component [Chitinasiproducens palmae]
MNEIGEEQKRFRHAMAHLSAAVNILTTDGPAGRCGITATAVCSVTDTPPTIIACVNRNSATNETFKANKRLCVNVLGGEHEALAQHFAGVTSLSMADRFGWADWDEGHGSVPVLKAALVNLQGRITRVEEVGTHSILFVELDDVRVDERESADSLVYFNRLFHRLKRAPTS